jgi:predicted Zn-dependent peptidase
VLIVAAGNVDHARLSRLVKKTFGRMPRGRRSLFPVGPPRSRGGVVTRAKNELEQLHLLLGVPTFPERHRQRYPLFVLNALLGGTMSSRLFQKVREERGLAYSVYSAVNSFSDSGVMLIYAGTSPGKGDELLAVVADEMRALRDKGPDPREVEVAREHLKGSLMLSLESTSSRMSNLARQEMYHGRNFSMEEVLAGLASVTTGQVHQMARRVFGTTTPALAAVGRTRSLKAVKRGLTL